MRLDGCRFERAVERSSFDLKRTNDAPFGPCDSRHHRTHYVTRKRQSCVTACCVVSSLHISVYFFAAFRLSFVFTILRATLRHFAPYIPSHPPSYHSFNSIYPTRERPVPPQPRALPQPAAPHFFFAFRTGVTAFNASRLPARLPLCRLPSCLSISGRDVMPLDHRPVVVEMNVVIPSFRASQRYSNPRR